MILCVPVVGGGDRGGVVARTCWRDGGSGLGLAGAIAVGIKGEDDLGRVAAACGLAGWVFVTRCRR